MTELIMDTDGKKMIFAVREKGETMNDLISRQALCEYALNQKDKSVTPNDIMRFPSAQFEIIHCKDCKYNASSHKCLQPDSFFLVPADDFYCGYAERKRTDERNDNK